MWYRRNKAGHWQKAGPLEELHDRLVTAAEACLTGPLGQRHFDPSKQQAAAELHQAGRLARAIGWVGLAWQIGQARQGLDADEVLHLLIWSPEQWAAYDAEIRNWTEEEQIT